MAPKRRYTDQQLIEAVKCSKSIAQVLEKLGLRPAGSNYDIIQTRIKLFGLDTSHFTGMGWRKGSKHPVIPRLSLESILVENSTYSSSYDL
jgi:hypothetical protein